MTEITEDDFKRAMGAFPSGVTVITTRLPDGVDVGMTASAFASVSLEPPLVLVCVQNRLDMCDFITTASSFGVSILTADQTAISNRFAGGFIDDHGRWQPWPEHRDKFEDLEVFRLEPAGCALLNGSSVGLQCTLEHAYAGGDHTIFVGRVTALKGLADDTQMPLVYAQGRYARLDTSPK
ncbi:MAG: flavin reductase family protein [Myxococcota bacterium]|nr:flavin reductase family protein [Myxococcota bacterium]